MTAEPLYLGDDDFDAFYASHYGHVAAFLTRRGARHADVDDLVQEAMLTTWTWRNRNPHADAEHELNYLFRVAESRLVDLWRRNRFSVPRPHFDDVALDDAESPPAVAERKEAHAALVAAVEQLPPVERALLIDAEIRMLPVAELEVRYAAKADTLRVRRFRTRQTLARRLAPLRNLGAVIPLHRLTARITRWRNEHTPPATAAAHSAAVVVATMSLVAGPFNGPLGPVPSPTHGETTWVATPHPILLPPGDQVVPAAAQAGVKAVTPNRPAATPRDQPARPAVETPGPTASHCVDGLICAGGGQASPTPGVEDVAYVVIPGVAGQPDRYVWVVPDNVEACDYWVETPVTGCMEGTPEPTPSPSATS